jgi:hypothetical protein
MERSARATDRLRHKRGGRLSTFALLFSLLLVVAAIIVWPLLAGPIVGIVLILLFFVAWPRQHIP